MKKERTTVLMIGMLILVASFSFGFSMKVGEGEIPFRLLGHLMTVTVKINDSPKEFNFVIDTGGAMFVSKDVADTLGLKQMGPQAKINTLHLPGFQIENIFCYTTFDFTLFNSLSIPIHGIIGSTLLERYRVIFDFESKTMALSEGPFILEYPTDSIRLKFRNHPVNNAPLIELRINGKTLDAMIDTGQPYAIVLPIDTFKNYYPEDFSGLLKSRGLMEKWPTTKITYNYLGRLNRVEVGDMKFAKILCLFGDLPRQLSMPLIGSDFLSQFRIYIDFPKDEIVLIPNSHFRLKDNLFSIGLNVGLSEDNEVFVEGIWENSPADKSGILVGDRIISYNSEKVSPDNLLKLQNALYNDKVDTIEFEIVSRGKKRSVLLKKTLLF
ncbi:PDZ domain-containing protein [Acidobacteriota bacterium]